jgi:hypothetical protein
MKPLEKQCGNLKQKKINDMENENREENQRIDIWAMAAALFDATQKITILDGRLVELTEKHIREVQQLTDRLDRLESEIMALHGDAKQQGLN